MEYEVQKVSCEQMRIYRLGKRDSLYHNITTTAYNPISRTVETLYNVNQNNAMICK